MSNSSENTPRRREKKPAKGWQKVLFHWRLPLVVVLILMVLSAVLVQGIAGSLAARQRAAEEAEAAAEAKLLTYEQAVVDVLSIEEGDIKPLVSLVPDDGRVSYDTETDRALLVFWTDAPDAFAAGEQMTLEADTYAYPDLELAAWGSSNKDILKNSKEKRLKQLLGLPESYAGTNFIVAWVTPERILRPAYQSDAQQGEMQLQFAETADAGFVAWFDGELTRQYFESPRPWTRLGYTYDWGRQQGEDIYGVTEFVIPAGTRITVQSVLTNDETITQLRKGQIE